MATQMHKIKGKALWAKVFERNRDTKSSNPNIQRKLDETEGQTTITLLLDQETMEEFKSTGSRKGIKITEDGPTVTLTRPWKHKIEQFGGAPQVVDHENKDWDDSVAIGNLSDVEVAFVTYDTSLGKGTRLEGVKVLELVPYDESESGEPKAPRLPF